ncbi:MAG: aldehyde dehydrogenase family protein [Bacteroidota bacterium]|nr:aldehyde dehydrogenase family protein [Bacteroidota bacterium]
MVILQTISPVDGQLYVERDVATSKEILRAVSRARCGQTAWRAAGISQRAGYCSQFVKAFAANSAEIAEEISWQMGRPILHAPGEVSGVAERARYMISVAEEALADIEPDPKPGFRRFIAREPLGVVLVIAPWNYPFLTAINAVMAAIMAGNAVILKPSSQTPLSAERFAEAFAAAGLPDGVFQFLHLTREDTARLIGYHGIDHVMFTGSVSGGRSIKQSAARRFIGVGLELGGKDPAYVRADASVEFTAKQLVDGAFYNAGQSCCAVERIYVHEDIFEDFVAAFVEGTRQLQLGDPLSPATTLGPVVRPKAAAFVQGQIADAVREGAQTWIDPSAYPQTRRGAAYVAPQVLTDVHHGMRIMKEETFGPAVGIMKVGSDDEAVALMNDSPFGLTGSVWTRDESAAMAVGNRVQTGTWFMNRCDYLDPALAWTGVKDSGQGCTLSRIGYEQLTRPKSFHLKLSG